MLPWPNLKNVPGIIKSCSTTSLNVKMIRKKRKGTPKIIWKIIRICRPNSKRCLLKREIRNCKEDKLLNKRTEITNTCRHRSINLRILLP